TYCSPPPPAKSRGRATPNAFVAGKQVASRRFEPNGLPAKVELLVTEIFAAGAQGKIKHLRKGERSNGREPCIITRHRLAENQRSQNVNACDKGKTTSQIRHQNKSSGYLATPVQEPHRILVAEVVKRQRTNRDVVCFNGV